jgi:hypothetical protein
VAVVVMLTVEAFHEGGRRMTAPGEPVPEPGEAREPAAVIES